jgi:hypothetical protein
MGSMKNVIRSSKALVIIRNQLCTPYRFAIFPPPNDPFVGFDNCVGEERGHTPSVEKEAGIRGDLNTCTDLHIQYQPPYAIGLRGRRILLPTVELALVQPLNDLVVPEQLMLQDLQDQPLLSQF